MPFFEVPPSCIHNKMVDCPEYTRNCSGCGWDPSVASRRIVQFAAEHPELIDELVYMGRLVKSKGV